MNWDKEQNRKRRDFFYLANTFSPLMITAGTAKIRPCSEKEARSKIRLRSWESVISHEITAEMLSERFQENVPFRRENLSLEQGDNVLVAAPQFRADSAREFTRAEIATAPWRFFWVMVR